MPTETSRNRLPTPRLALAVFAHKCHLLASLEGERGAVKYLMVAISLAHAFHYKRKVARARSRRKTQVYPGVVDFVNLYALYFGQLLDTALYGSLRLGHNVKIGYFAQNQAQMLDGEFTVFDTIDRVAVGDIRTKIRDILGAFMEAFLYLAATELIYFFDKPVEKFTVVAHYDYMSVWEMAQMELDQLKEQYSQS